MSNRKIRLFVGTAAFLWILSLVWLFRGVSGEFPVMLWGLVSPTELQAGTVAPASQPPQMEDETLTYNVYWKVASAGVATLRIEKTPNSGEVHIVGDARSSRFVSTLYRVEDHFESFVSSGDFCSLRMSKKINEGRRHRESIVEVSPAQRIARWQDRDLSVPESPVRRAQVQTPGCVQDVLSALFYMRSQPFVLGKTVHFPLQDNGKIYNIVVEIQQRETIKTDAGTFSAIRVEPKVFGELFKKPGRMYVWYSDDDEHQLLQVKARIPVGSITAVLAPNPPQKSATASGGQ